MTSLTSEQVQAMINAALKEQLETLQDAGRIVDPAAPAANPITQQAATPVASTTSTSQFVTDPYKMDINPADKQGLALYNKATEPLPDKEKLSLSQEKATSILQAVKQKNETFFWGKSINMVPQSYPSDPSNQRSLILQPNRVSLTSVLSEAARCWGGTVLLPMIKLHWTQFSKQRQQLSSLLNPIWLTGRSFMSELDEQ